ncbi:MAG: tRNA pseudouridine(38-40) synthase TruA [Candidatus Cardinium sp.]|uniref:tRNA pseudouridine synthase A n=1 Tax=Cardinium endosymbiont of Dermatophagoides farinae TaxID=2597823 RepID=UPI00118257EB|nr:tRNA pseudouridine synthase A [Cardinium endosymbiont of Dermatophagoides farinae]TSJ80956.1 tRNA pseudouridine synthase A [Cardinium endosymbiont of Dermatophagoides farinae]UWW96982.1 MAG: tRNA pseudouridine(38-40) synthase TruA [Candidatus Cardinium sp.]
MRYFIYIAYLGKAYSGWQVQRNALAVQQVVEEALGRLLPTAVAISGSSRTDKGVHARQQVAHFDLIGPIDPADVSYRLNRILPSDISITAIRPVVDGAHARLDACYRSYAYTIITQKDPFYRDSAVWLCHVPPLALLNQIAALFVIQADFEFFSKTTDATKSFVCNIKEAFWLQIDQKIVFHIKADRFLRGMVRTIVGTILKAATGKMDITALAQLIRQKPAVRPVLTLMPPHGLTLVEVGYPEALFIKENAS